MAKLDRITHTPARSLAVLILALALSACGTREGPAPPEPTTGPTTVRIDNRSFLEMTIYVIRQSERVRIGQVPGLSERVLEIPSRLVFGHSSLQFMADPIGSSQQARSFDIVVEPGDEIRLTIPPM